MQTRAVKGSANETAGLNNVFLQSFKLSCSQIGLKNAALDSNFPEVLILGNNFFLSLVFEFFKKPYFFYVQLNLS